MFDGELIWDSQIFSKESLLLNQNAPLIDAFTSGYIYGQMGFAAQSFYYRPLVNLTFMLEGRLTGLKPLSLRLTNFLIFSLSLISLFVFFSRISSSGAMAYLVTALFAFSPIITDNLLWVVGRCDLLLLLFGMLLLLCFFSAISSGKKRFYYLSLVCFLLGLLSKETFAVFIPVLIVFEWLVRRRFSALFHSATALFGLLFFAIKGLILNIGGLNLLQGPGLWNYVSSLISVLGYYLRVIFFPFTATRFETLSRVVTIPFGLLGGVGLILILILIRRFRKRRQLLLPLITLCLFLAPYLALSISNLAPFKLSARYMLLPSLACFWLLAQLLLTLRRPIMRILVVAILVVSALFSLVRSLDYRDNITYWSTAAEELPASGFCRLKLVESHLEKGDVMGAAVNLKMAENSSFGPDTAIGFSLARARIRFMQARYGEAKKQLEKLAVPLDPYRNYHVLLLRADIEQSLGHFNETETILRHAIDQFPLLPKPAERLISLYLGQTRWQEAILFYETAKGRITASSGIDIREMSKRFRSWNRSQKVYFFKVNRNYAAAIDIMQQFPSATVPDRMLLVELHYLLGKPDKAENVLKDLRERYQDDPRFYNTAGFFYQKTLFRLSEARRYFSRSLGLKPDQPEIRLLLESIQ